MLTLNPTYYIKRTISSLMSELDELGGSSSIKLNSNKTIAILSQDIAYAQLIQPSEDEAAFVALRANKNKYRFDHVLRKASDQHSIIQQLLSQLFAGFNVSILLSGQELNQFAQFLPKEQQGVGRVLVSTLNYPIKATKQQPIDLIKQGGAALTKPDHSQMYCASSVMQILKGCKPVSNDCFSLTTIVYPERSSAQLRIFTFPNAPLSTYTQCNRQITQILEYLRQHGGADKCYKQSIGKLFIKKQRLTTVLIDNLFDNSYNYVFVDLNKLNPEELEPELDLLCRFRGIDKVVRRVEPRQYHSVDYQDVSAAVQTVASNLQARSTQQNKRVQTKIENTYQTLYEANEQLQYCKGLQRKTHQFSVSHPRMNSQTDEISFDHFNPDSTINNLLQTAGQNYPHAQDQFRILNSEHIIEVSKYHQTIQNLNARLLVLSQDKGLHELCAVYQKQIMHLEFVIDSLRKQLALNLNKTSQDDIKNMFRKNNQETVRLEKERKAISSVRNQEIRKILNTEMQQLQDKLKKSQQTRSLLSAQMEELTQRLDLREKELHKAHQKLSHPTHLTQQQLASAKPSLNVKSSQQYEELLFLLQKLSEGTGGVYITIVNKINALFENLSAAKTQLAASNDFLMQLQEVLESRLGSVDSGIVMDCNKFIRNHLLKSVEIIE